MDVKPVKLSQLDQLEAMVNLVLEQTGRTFAESAKGNNANNIANATRLKQMLPKAINNYHDALDELEQELTMARAVIRRDYGLFQAQQATYNGQMTADNGLVTNQTTIGIKTPEEDIQMDDAPIAQVTDASTVPKAADGNDPLSPKEPAPKPDPELKQLSPPKIDASVQNVDPDVDTDPQTAGGYSAMDFDDLFNDPDSAEPGNPSDNSLPISPSKQEQGQQEDTAPITKLDSSPLHGGQDFSFETFNAQHADDGNDNDNDPDNGDINSLLPGLESYANASGNEIGGGGVDSGEPDFSILDDLTAAASAADKPDQQVDLGPTGSVNDLGISIDGVGSGVGISGGTNVGAGGEAQVIDQSIIEQQRDNTFDDLLNFGDFDMTGLDGGDGNFEDGDNRFDESFFDLS